MFYTQRDMQDFLIAHRGEGVWLRQGDTQVRYLGMLARGTCLVSTGNSGDIVCTLVLQNENAEAETLDLGLQEIVGFSVGLTDFALIRESGGERTLITFGPTEMESSIANIEEAWDPVPADINNYVRVPGEDNGDFLALNVEILYAYLGSKEAGKLLDWDPDAVLQWLQLASPNPAYHGSYRGNGFSLKPLGGYIFVHLDVASSQPVRVRRYKLQQKLEMLLTHEGKPEGRVRIPEDIDGFSRVPAIFPVGTFLAITPDRIYIHLGILGGEIRRWSASEVLDWLSSDARTVFQGDGFTMTAHGDNSVSVRVDGLGPVVIQVGLETLKLQISLLLS